MKKQNRILVLLGMAVVAIFFSLLMRNSIPEKDKPNPTGGTTYYTGPMRPLGGKGYLATEDNKITPLPDPPVNKKDPKKPKTTNATPNEGEP